MGNTWGISGTAFLLLYTIGLAGVWGSIRLTRRRLAGRPLAEPVELDAYEAALLAGGESLVATVVMTKLRTADIIEAGDTWLRESFVAAELRRRPDSATPLRIGALAELDHPVELAVYDTVREGGNLHPDEVRAEARASTAFADLRRSLEKRRLLFDADARQRLRRQWAWYLPLLVAGAIRVQAGYQRDKTVAYLVFLLGVTAVLLTRDVRLPFRTPAGDSALKRRRDLEHPLAGQARAGEVPVASLPLAIALFGTAALWSADPWLAAALGVSYRSTGSGFLATGGGGCGGGCGGGGGGGCGG